MLPPVHISSGKPMRASLGRTNRKTAQSDKPYCCPVGQGKKTSGNMTETLQGSYINYAALFSKMSA